jgi:hypothetical protein
MSCTFYLFPSRVEAGRAFANYLDGLFPGLDWQQADVTEMADRLAELAEVRHHVFVVYREDLTDGEDCAGQLEEVYGAEEGDLVVEVAPEAPAGVVPLFWRIGEKSALRKAA